MKILLAGPRGFCAGVNMAVEALDRAVQMFGAPLYAFHEIVHNRHVVDRFRAKGVIFIDRIEEAPSGSRLMYSAHGVSPQLDRAARDRDLQVIDATCPLVRKVHHEAVRFAREGYTIFLIGHRDHDEIVGTMGEAPDRIILIETVADVDGIDLPADAKVAYLTQTTLSIDEAGAIIQRLRSRFPQCVGSAKEDICYATQNRQEAVKTLLAESDIVLVVGSRNSSNSNRLAEVARESGRPAYLVDSAEDVDLGWFAGHETVLITAGASAPEDLVQGCVQLLTAIFGAATVERAVREEHVEFPLPLEVR